MQTSMQIGLQSEYANLSVCGEISCYMKFINGKTKALFKTVLDFLLELKNEISLNMSASKNGCLPMATQAIMH